MRYSCLSDSILAAWSSFLTRGVRSRWGLGCGFYIFRAAIGLRPLCFGVERANNLISWTPYLSAFQRLICGYRRRADGQTSINLHPSPQNITVRSINNNYKPFPPLRFLSSFGHGDKNEMGKRACRALFLLNVSILILVIHLYMVLFITVFTVLYVQ